MFYINKTIAFSEVAPDGMIKITDMTDYFQDVCTFQSDELGVGMDPLRERGFGWVASSWQIVVNRYPRLGEKVRVGTAPYEFKGVMGMRNFVLESPDGELLACANSIWSFVDIANMTLTRIPADISGAYAPEEKIDMEYAPRKIKIPEELAALQPIEVSYHNLDSNDHVNNAQYISMAEDLVESGRRARQIRVEYRASARRGDIIMPYVNENDRDDIITVVLSDRDTNPYVLVEFTL
ncbi:MAG: acyl-[acyl-carrier-protein] thioesterase [Lachnospiraceae bacterium]|nr:acyl-[acyl-carrier-protein] thioesterase [Lachnospiraceae bacterium]